MNNRENRRVLLPLGVGALILLVVFFAIPSGALFPVSDKAGVDKVGRNPVELAHEPELRALNREGAGANCEADDPSLFLTPTSPTGEVVKCELCVQVAWGEGSPKFLAAEDRRYKVARTRSFVLLVVDGYLPAVVQVQPDVDGRERAVRLQRPASIALTVLGDKGDPLGAEKVRATLGDLVDESANELSEAVSGELTRVLGVTLSDFFGGVAPTAVVHYLITRDGIDDQALPIRSRLNGVTDGGGRFVFFGLPSGVWISADVASRKRGARLFSGAASALVYKPEGGYSVRAGWPIDPSPRSVVLEEGAHEELEVRLFVDTRVFGKIDWKSGRFVADMFHLVRSGDSSGSLHEKQLVGQDGDPFLFDSVLPGEKRVSITWQAEDLIGISVVDLELLGGEQKNLGNVSPNDRVIPVVVELGDPGLTVSGEIEISRKDDVAAFPWLTIPVLHVHALRGIVGLPDGIYSVRIRSTGSASIRMIGGDSNGAVEVDTRESRASVSLQIDGSKGNGD